VAAAAAIAAPTSSSLLPASARHPPPPVNPMLMHVRTRKQLVLDLDETLVHSVTEWAVSYHFTVSVHVPASMFAAHTAGTGTGTDSDGYAIGPFSGDSGGQQGQLVPAVFYVTKRPHVDTFLKKVSQWYDVSVFTSSVRSYADAVIDKLDKRRVIGRRFFRDSCVDYGDGQVHKELRALRTDLSQIVLLDNYATAFSLHRENGLPISSWTGDDPKDEALLNLIPFLFALRYVGDVRSILCLRLLHEQATVCR
jgi:Dullard-like phosphatase family protein